MEATDYKSAKISSNALRRDVFDTIIRIVRLQEPQLADRIEVESVITQLPVPAKHFGPTSSHWISLSLSDELVEAIEDALSFAEASAVGLDGSTTTEASAMGGLLDLWLQWTEKNNA